MAMARAGRWGSPKGGGDSAWWRSDASVVEEECTDVIDFEPVRAYEGEGYVYECREVVMDMDVDMDVGNHYMEQQENSCREWDVVKLEKEFCAERDRLWRGFLVGVGEMRKSGRGGLVGGSPLRKVVNVEG